jgi:hypothetical protein
MFQKKLFPRDLTMSLMWPASHFEFETPGLELCILDLGEFISVDQVKST